MDRKIYYFLVLLIIVATAGSYFILDSLQSLRTEVRNLDLEIKFLGKNQTSSPKTNAEPDKGAANEPTPPLGTETNPNGSVSIPTSIILDFQSSPILSPQTKLTATIGSLTRAGDGTLQVNLRVYTNEATSYSAWEPRDYFQIINLNGENQKPIESKGLFGSMPPKSSTSGNLIFKVDPLATTIILQIGPNESAKFYEFNFKNKNYKETVIG